MSEAETATEHKIEAPKPQLRENQMLVAEHRRTVWSAEVPVGHTLEDALEPGYLWSCHRNLQPGHFVELVHVTHEFYGLFYILKVDEISQAIIMAPVIAPVKLRTLPIRLPSLAEVRFEYMGEAARWCAIKGKTIIPGGRSHLTEEAAREWYETETAAVQQEKKSGKGKAA